MNFKFQCPMCKGSMTVREKTIVCNSCSSQWDIVDGIPKFSKTDQYFGEIPRGQMQRVNSVAKKCGWRTALLKMREKHPWVYNYATDASRADWQFLLPMTKKGIVLDAGCGWGAITFPLAQTSGLVIAMDSTFERVKFLDIRKRQEKMTNIFPICADILDFPFPENSFDTIILNGVLEWIGCLNKHCNPQRTQEKALKKVFNGLKETGNLYIGIENRYGFNYLLGQRDDHSHLRFTSILPRRIASLYSQIAKGENYATYTYSYGEYAKLLAKAGFSSTEFYCPLPNYREPRYIIPLKNSSPLKYLLENIVDTRYLVPKKWTKLASFAKTPMWILKRFVPSYIIICQKRDAK